MKKAYRLSPYSFANWGFQAGLCNYFTGRFEPAISESKKLIKRIKRSAHAKTSWGVLIASHMELGQEAEAKAEVKNFLTEYPGKTVGKSIKDFRKYPFKDFSFLERYSELLRKAGMPE